MALYLYEASYSDESWAAQLKKRENILDRIRPLGKTLNLDVKDAWYALGDHDERHGRLSSFRDRSDER